MPWKQSVWALLAAVLLAPAATVAQEETAVEVPIRELSSEVTSEALIEVLQPQEEAPAVFRKRGVKVTPKCDFYRRQRGKPVANIAAIPILFEYDSDKLTTESIRSLDELGKALTSSRLSPCCFRIEGHTDGEGSDEYNRNLSQRRASSVIDYLVRTFRIDRGRMMAQGLGESKPIANNNTDDGRKRNRRVQIVNLGYGEVEP